MSYPESVEQTQSEDSTSKAFSRKNLVTLI